MLLPRPTKIAPPHFILRRIRGPHGHRKDGLEMYRHQEEWDYAEIPQRLAQGAFRFERAAQWNLCGARRGALDRVALFGSHLALTYAKCGNQATFDALSEQLGLEAPQTPAELFALQATWDGSLTGDNRIDDTLQSFRVIREIQAKNGPKGAHRYIISNCRVHGCSARIRLGQMDSLWRRKGHFRHHSAL